MTEYHKIHTIFKRDPTTNNKNLLLGEFSLPEFEYLQRNVWVFTEKVDGTNIRVIVLPQGNGITFNGKTDESQIDNRLVAKLQERFLGGENEAKLATVFPDGGVMYFEGYGAKIQKGGGNYRPDQDVVLFDVRVGTWWLQRKDVEDVASKLQLDVVPILGIGDLHDMIEKVRTGFKSRWGDFVAEGIVARPETELMTRSGERVITKLKHKDFPQEKSNATV